jgi:IS1 family transposase
MANVLNKEKQIMAISALAEGSSIRSIERMTGIHRDTIMRLGVKVGQACEQYMDKNLKDLDCERLQVDEIWGFVGKKQKHATDDDKARGLGNAWTFVAIDADTKLVPCFKVGSRDAETANEFVTDLSKRLKNRVQISSDSLAAYVDAIEQGFGIDVDYGQIIKAFSSADKTAQGRYSPPKVVGVKKSQVVGNPNAKDISTSYIERQNLTMRMHCRRLTRLTNAFSKKLENFKAAVALHFAYYNYVKTHGTLKTTPAMAAGVASSFFTVGDLLDIAA